MVSKSSRPLVGDLFRTNLSRPKFLPRAFIVSRSHSSTDKLHYTPKIIKMAAAAAALRLLKPISAATPFFSLFSNPRLKPSTYPLLLFSTAAASRHQRSLCVSATVSSGEATKPEPIELEKGAKIREFSRRLKIADIKGGDDEGLSRLGETLVVRGWVRTLRAQSSVTFIEVGFRIGFWFFPTIKYDTFFVN